MDKIKFVNNGQPAINDTNLNQMQTNIENAISTLETNIDTEIGQIIESGSNMNGSYIKFSDGTMICRKYINFGQKAISNTWGSFYESEKMTIGNYPEPFIEIPQIFVMPLNTFFIEKDANGISKTSWGDFYAVRPVSQAIYITVDCFAIGKWK